MKNLLCAGLGLIWTVLSANAQQFSAEDIARRTIERRAIEVVNWGMSAVNTDLMLQEMLTKTTGKMNQIVYWSRPLDWHNQTLTQDAGPIVLEIPAAGIDGSLNGNIVDTWQVPLEDAVHPAPTRARAASICCCHPVTPMPFPRDISCCGPRHLEGTRCCART